MSPRRGREPLNRNAWALLILLAAAGGGLLALLWWTA